LFISAINLFSCSRQATKGGRDGGEEVWLEKTYFTTEEAFPTVLRRSEVIAMEVLEISPIENALHEVEQKTKELASLNLKYAALAKTAQVVSTNALSMSLNGAVDAPVEGGISSYRQVFFNPDYISRYPERTELVDKLRKAIDDQVSLLPCIRQSVCLKIPFAQVRVIDDCLKLHGHLCPPEILPFHGTLENFFHKNFHEEIRRLTADGASDHLTDQFPGTSQYQPSLHGQQSHKRSVSTTSTTRPLQVSRQYMTPPLSPLSTRGAILTSEVSAGSKQTPLQRHLAHLARHGINGVSSGPGDIGDTVSISAGSPHDSFVNVVNGIPAAALSNASVANSNLGSVGSLKGRFSRFGSLNFGRRHGNS
jgi:dedicator of cytokinesis protein 3